MEIITIATVVMLLLAAVLLVGYPLWQHNRSDPLFRAHHHSGYTLEENQARYQATLVAIKDLMFDHEMGKVSTEDYDKLLVKTKQEAAALRQQIDRLSQVSGSTPANDALDTEIERLIAQTRQQSATDQTDGVQREVAVEIARLKSIQLGGKAQQGRFNETEAHICTRCGKQSGPDDRFCSGCGQPLIENKTRRICPHCNRRAEPNDAFCTGCGAALVPTPQTANSPQQ